MHEPVLLNEIIDFLDPQPGDFVIDGTVNGGGHARAIWEAMGEVGTLLGLDLDKDLISSLQKKIQSKNVLLRTGNYADLPAILKRENLGKASGLLLDLGFSSNQLEGGRGFSFEDRAKGEPLLMTYSEEFTPAYEILNQISEKDIADIIYRYGEERNSRRIAKGIVEKRPIKTVGDLLEAIHKANPRRGKLNPATRTFQALRIYVNGELQNLEKILSELEEVLKPGGKALIISFHSLEDRIVKHAFQKLAKENKAEILTRKPIEAKREEILKNPRSRSAKLRVIKLI